jgi:cbb3-type cytochrome oxidase subunit 3
MYEYMNQMMEQLGISIWLFVLIMIWSYAWKLLAFWKSARKNSPVWFILFAFLNTMGILEILYLFIFSEKKKNNFKHKKALKRKR